MLITWEKSVPCKRTQFALSPSPQGFSSSLPRRFSESPLLSQRQGPGRIVILGPMSLRGCTFSPVSAEAGLHPSSLRLPLKQFSTFEKFILKQLLECRLHPHCPPPKQHQPWIPQLLFLQLDSAGPLPRHENHYGAERQINIQAFRDSKCLEELNAGRVLDN